MKDDMSKIMPDKGHIPSKMRYSPRENRLFTWVKNRPGDLRAVYNEVTNGVFKLATSGRNGELNKKILRDQD